MANNNNQSSINPFENFVAPSNPFASAQQPDNPFGVSRTSAGGGGGLAWGAAPASQQQPIYDLDTTYEPHTAVPVQPSSGSSSFLMPAMASLSDAKVPAVPASSNLAFTSTTAAQHATGNIRSVPGTGVPSGAWGSASQAAGGPPRWGTAASTGAWGPPPTSAPGRDDGNFGASATYLPGQPGQPQQLTASTSATRPLLIAGGGAGGDKPLEDYAKYAFYNIRKYRPFFDVDTKEVGWRVLSSFIGAFKPDFMDVTHEAPDLYGPFWIATTLIFVTAAAGNFSSYLAFYKDSHQSPPPAPPDASSAPSSGAVNGQWFADSTKLGTSAGIFYGYIFIISLVLWLWVKYLRASVKLVSMFCVYGYALSIFVPVSLVCVVPNDIVRWVMVMVATLVSGAFLVMNMRRTLSEVDTIKSVWLLSTVGALHVGLGVGLKLYFFNY